MLRSTEPRIVELDSSTSSDEDFVVASNEPPVEVTLADATGGWPSEPATKTSDEQNETEESVRVYFETYRSNLMATGEEKAKLMKASHASFSARALNGVSRGYSALDASRPWMVYWILHSLELLNSLPDNEMQSRVIDFLKRCQNASGGFGGGPGQLSHLAPTYAAVNALCIIGTPEAYSVVDRAALHAWLLTLKDRATGGFRMHDGGELDVRGTYCAMSAARLMSIPIPAPNANVLTPELMDGAAEFVAACQTYEGGLGGEPGNEAHGGYAFCGFAAMIVMNKTHLLDVPNLAKWAVDRQMTTEGGFQGRTNKLVDSCYSFWQGGLFPLLDRVYFNPDKYSNKTKTTQSESNSDKLDPRDPDNLGGWMFNQRSLQEYLLICCQDSRGGMRDKPGKSPDYYHTCYALSGLSVAQHNPDHYDLAEMTLFGLPENLVEQTDPVHNIGPDKVERALEFFKNSPLY